MGIQLPGWLRSVSSVALGQDWPECDETSLRRVADAWELAAVQVDRAGADAERAIAPALDAISGVVNEAIAGRWENVSASTDELVAVCRRLADECDTAATDVEHAKLSIITALALLAGEIATLMAAAVATGGIAGAGIPAAEAATQVAVRIILRDLVLKLGTNVGRSVLEDGAISSALQVFQMAEGNRAGFDWATLGKDAYGSAVASSTSFGLSTLPVARAVAGDLGAAVGQEFGDEAVGLVTGAVGGRLGEDAKGALSPAPAGDRKPDGTSSLNMN